MPGLLREIGRWIVPPFLMVTVAGVVPVSSWQGGKKYETVSNQQALEMLNTIEADIKEHYYDAKMHGLDLDKRFDKAREEINHAKSQDEAFLDIAGALAALQDSHTRFIPPARPYGVDYGWVVQAIGNSDCFATAVRPESDAAQKGVRPGDQILSINGVPLARQNISYVEYGYGIFPQAGLHLVLRSPRRYVQSHCGDGQGDTRSGDRSSQRCDDLAATATRTKRSFPVLSSGHRYIGVETT